MTHIHDLKVHASVWHALESGIKTWEFRKNDRDFRIGDLLFLRLYNPETKEYAEPRAMYRLIRQVTYILYGPQFGIPEGYCVMSIK